MLIIFNAPHKPTISENLFGNLQLKQTYCDENPDGDRVTERNDHEDQGNTGGCYGLKKIHKLDQKRTLTTHGTWIIALLGKTIRKDVKVREVSSYRNRSQNTETHLQNSDC